MGGQPAGALVLGYKIERHDAYDRDGRLHSTRYDVRCPHTDRIVAQAPSLRMAKRLVVMHELQDFTGRPARSSASERRPFAA